MKLSGMTLGVIVFSILILASVSSAESLDPIKYGVKIGVSFSEMDVDSEIVDLD